MRTSGVLPMVSRMSSPTGSIRSSSHQALIKWLSHGLRRQGGRLALPLQNTGAPGNPRPKRCQTDQAAAPDFPGPTQLIERHGVCGGRRVAVTLTAFMDFWESDLRQIRHLLYHALIGLMRDQIIEVIGGQLGALQGLAQRLMHHSRGIA